MPKKSWGREAFTIHHPSGADTRIILTGRERWALECLMVAGAKGCTPIDHPGPRWAAYVHDLKGFGVEIDSVAERHGGPFAGRHVRYVLRSQVSRANLKGGAA